MISHVGRKQTVQIGTVQVRLGRLTRGVFRAWHEWAVSTLPDLLGPITALFDRVPKETQEVLATEAIRIAEERQCLNGPELSELWLSDRGLAHVLALLLMAEGTPEQDSHDLASLALLSPGVGTVCKWIGVASGKYVASAFDLETRAFIEAGLMPQPPIKLEPIDWGAVDHNIFETTGLTPVQIDDMTFPEIDAVLKSPPDPEKIDNIQRARWYKQLTAKQRLMLAIWTAES